MKLFNEHNTEDYTVEELDAMNAEWAANASAEGLDEGTDAYNEAAKKFSDEVSGR